MTEERDPGGVATRHFGLEEANRLVPFLNHTFQVVRPWVERLKLVMGSLEQPIPAPERHELVEESRRLIVQISQGLQPLMDMGIEIKAPEGLVDFRAWHEGRTVLLCWSFGEPKIAYWHELETGYAGRRPIEPSEGFAPTYLS